jgi:hypothetical protein
MVNGGVCANAADTNSADVINAVAAPTAPREKRRVRVIINPFPYFKIKDAVWLIDRIFNYLFTSIIPVRYRTTITAELAAIAAVLARPVSTKSGVPTT